MPRKEICVTERSRRRSVPQGWRGDLGPLKSGCRERVLKTGPKGCIHGLGTNEKIQRSQGKTEALRRTFQPLLAQGWKHFRVCLGLNLLGLPTHQSGIGNGLPLAPEGVAQDCYELATHE
jgi:hypothetical protein